MRTFRAPGRANLIGEHTDHTDGLVLPAAIDRAVTLEAELGGPAIALRSAQADGEVVVAADGSQVPDAGWGRFVAAVAAELHAVGREPIGLRGQLTSDLPQGSGLSSSAALEVVVAIALCAAAELELPPLELAALCRRAEYRAVGVPSGIMDQAASLVGRAGHGVLLDCGALTYEHVPLPEDHVLLLIDTGVRRQLETSGYAQRSDELQDGSAGAGRATTGRGRCRGTRGAAPGCRCGSGATPAACGDRERAGPGGSGGFRVAGSDGAR
jgi:galactokinase